MSPVPDDFEQLRRVLALKRYEQPPPGYFHSFSRQVIVRIKAGEVGNEIDTSVWSIGVGTLFQRIWAALDARPVLAGAFGVAVCGFFVTGALISDSTAATSEADAKPAPYVARATPVWEPQATTATQVPSMVGAAVPDDQPADSSLFREIKAAQQRMLPRQRLEQVNFSIPVSGQ